MALHIRDEELPGNSVSRTRWWSRPGEVHGFTASPGGPLRMTCLHLNDSMITEWR